MNKHYRLRLTQVTPATYDNTLFLARNAINNDDYLLIVVATDKAPDILRDIYGILLKEFEANKIKEHVKLKVPFAYRKLQDQILDSFK